MVTTRWKPEKSFKQGEGVFVVTYGVSEKGVGYFVRLWTVMYPTHILHKRYKVRTIGFFGNEIIKEVLAKNMYKSEKWAEKACERRNNANNHNRK